MVDMNIIWRNFLFPPPSSSIFVMLMTIITFVSISRAGLKEFRGKHLQYSKLFNWNKHNKSSNSKSLASGQNYPPPKFQIKVLTSKVGMFVLYAPAFVFGVASFVVFPDEGLRFLLLRLALTIHFLKRVLEKVLFPPPPSIFVTTMSILNFGSLANAGFSEFKGKNHMQYSKFFNWNNDNSSSTSQYPISPVPKQQQNKLASKVGMLVIYAPACLFGVASFVVFPDEGIRFLLLQLALTTHFLKRVLEVLFVHKFGGSGVTLDAAITISLSYFLSTLTMIYTQHLSREFTEPLIDLKYVGVGLFLVGILGNFYHHYILSTLRNEGEKEYKIPKGGLFNQVICPHYLFEVLIFLGVSCIAQTLYSCAFTAGTALYLSGRSYATRKWYLSKFEDFPQDVKALIPFIF